MCIQIKQKWMQSNIKDAYPCLKTYVRSLYYLLLNLHFVNAGPANYSYKIPWVQSMMKTALMFRFELIPCAFDYIAF